MPRYERPGFFNKIVGNSLVGLLVRIGMKPAGAYLLSVRGRKSGETRTVPVNPMEHEGARYLIAPRGETEWVRNLRAAGEGVLRTGSTKEAITVQEELGDDAKPPLLREYLVRWSTATQAYFDAAKDSPDEELRRIAPNHPVFRISSKNG